MATVRLTRPVVDGSGGAACLFATIMTELAAQTQNTEMMMLDAAHLKTGRTASSFAVQGGARTADRVDEGRAQLETAVLADAKGRPIHMVLSAGQSWDRIDARALRPTIPWAGCPTC